MFVGESVLWLRLGGCGDVVVVLCVIGVSFVCFCG